MSRAPSRRSRPGSALPDSGGGERRRRQAATHVPRSAPASAATRDPVKRRTAVQERAIAQPTPDDDAAPEMCLCVSCGGRFAVDALSESAAARLVKHYRNEIHKREDRYVARAIESSFKRRRLVVALRKVWPRLITMARDTRRPALARELERF